MLRYVQQFAAGGRNKWDRAVNNVGVGTARHKISVGKQTASITRRPDTRSNLKRLPNDPSRHRVDPARFVCLPGQTGSSLVGRGFEYETLTGF